MAQPFPAADAALIDEAAEAEIARAIEAVQELRGWRDGVGAPPGRTLQARLDADGYDRTLDAVARLARVEWSANGTQPVATVPVPGGSIAILTVGRRRHRGRGARAPPSARAGSRARSPAPRASSPTAASSTRRPRRSSRPSATSSRACAPSSRPWIELVAGAGRGPPPLAGAVRHEVRPRAHAPAADRARQPAAARSGAIHVVGTNGKSSTVRMAAAILEAHGVRTGAYLSPHLATFAERIRIGDARPRARPLRRGGGARRRGRRARSTATLTGGEHVTQFELLTAAAFAELAEQRASRSRSWRRASAAATTPPTCWRRRSPCSPTSGSSTRAGSGPRSPTSRARSSRSCAPGSTLVVGPLEPEVEHEVAQVDARVRRAPTPPTARRSRASSARTSPSPRTAAAAPARRARRRRRAARRLGDHRARALRGHRARRR